MARGGRPRGGRRSGPRNRQRYTDEDDRSTIAAIASAVVPGLGQAAVNENIKKGAIIFLVATLSIPLLGGFGAVLSLGAWVYGIWDAWRDKPFDHLNTSTIALRIGAGIAIVLAVALLFTIILGSEMFGFSAISIARAANSVGINVNNPVDLVTAPAVAGWNLTKQGAATTSRVVSDSVISVQCQFTAVQNNPQNPNEAVDLCIAEKKYGEVCQEEVAQQIEEGEIREEEQQQAVNQCIRDRAGLSTEQTEEEQQQGEWNFVAQNYLAVNLQQEHVQNAPHLEPICGQNCLVVEATFENRGNRRVQIQDFLLELQGSAGKLPMMVTPEDRIIEDEKGKKYSLKYFIEGTGRLRSWQHTSDIGEGESIDSGTIEDWLLNLPGTDDVTESELSDTRFALRPDETQTVTFLANVTQYRTYIRQDVLDRLERQAETIQQQIEDEGNNISTPQEYCQDTYGDEEDASTALYSGGELYANASRQQQYNYETFPDFAGEVCMEDAEDAARGSVDSVGRLFGSVRNQPTPVVKANYSSKTTSILNLYVTNIEYWDSLSQEEKRQKRAEFGCEPVGLSSIDKQRTQDLNDAISFLMFTDCEVNYYPDDFDTDNQVLIEVQAKGDTQSASIDAFRIDQLEGVTEGATGTETAGICSTGIGSATDSNPSIYEGEWFKRTEDVSQSDWNTPRTACLREIPQVSEEQQQDIINLGLTARYTAQTSSQGEQVNFN